MKKIKKLSFLLFFCLALIACSSQESTKKELEKSEKKEEISTNKKAFRMATDAVRTLDSVKATDTASFSVLSNVQESLLVLNNNKPDLGAAQSYELSADGKKYTFNLREGLKWHDGKPLVAADFKYAWMRLIDPKVGASYAFFLFGVKNAKDYYLNKGVKAEDVGIKAINDRTLVVELNEPIPFFNQIAAFPGLAPQRKDIVEANKDAYGSSPTKLAYSGPYMVKEWIRGGRVVLAKNPNYWNAKNISVEEIKMLVIKEASTRYQMFMDGQLDTIAATSGEYIERLKKAMDDKKFSLKTATAPRTEFIAFNFKSKKALLSKKVRLAFSLATDRENYVLHILKTNAPAYALASPGMLVDSTDYRKAVKEPLKDFSLAKDPKELLIEGLAELGLDKDPAKLSLDFLVRDSTAEIRTQAEFLKNNWEKKLGVNIEIKPSADFSDYLQKKARGEFDLIMQGWNADYNSPLSFLDLFTSTNGINSGKYSNPRVDTLVEELSKEQNTAKRIELFKEIENIYILKDPVLIPLYYKSINNFEKNYVKGLQLSLFGGVYQLRWLSLD